MNHKNPEVFLADEVIKVNTIVKRVSTYRYSIRYRRDRFQDVMDYFHDGWPIIIPDSNNWFFLKNVTIKGYWDYYIVEVNFDIEVPKKLKINSRCFSPLNRYDDGYENEELIKAMETWRPKESHIATYLNRAQK